MSRVKRGTIANKRRSKLLKLAKGYRFARSRKERAAREALHHAGNHAFAHRRDKKGTFRRLWNTRINAAVCPLGLSYSRFMHLLKESNIVVNRKMLSEIAAEQPETFQRIVASVQK